jgi:hypothetical protein
VKHSLPAYSATISNKLSLLPVPTINYCRCNMKKLCVVIFLFATGVFDNGDQPRVVNIFPSLENQGGFQRTKVMTISVTIRIKETNFSCYLELCQLAAYPPRAP